MEDERQRKLVTDPPQGKENELRDALAEAAPIYRKDPGTLGWHVLSGKKDAKGSFVAVERYENAEAIKTHAANPVSLSPCAPLTSSTSRSSARRCTPSAPSRLSSPSTTRSRTRRSFELVV